MQIRPMLPEDWERVATIYAEGLDTGQATFETTVPTRQEWEAAHLPSCRVVAVDDDEVVGWSALSPVSGRHVYEGVAEASTYVAAGRRQQGVGGALLDAVIEASEAEGIWTLQASTFPENLPSLLLLQSRRFRIVGNRIRIGKHQGHWRDTVLLERRSTKIGV